MSRIDQTRSIKAVTLGRLTKSSAILLGLMTLSVIGFVQPNALARRNGTLIPFGNSVLGTNTPCVACHGDFSINQGGSVTINGLPSQFISGRTYDLSLSVTGGAGSVIGTQIVAVHEDDSASGVLVPVSSNLVSHTYSQRPVPILTHSSPLSSRTINFRWTAPASPQGRVTFKFAANSANDNFSTSGDVILYGVATTEPEKVLDDSPSLFFSQIVNGDAGGVQNQSRVILRNTSAIPLIGQIRFRNSDGSPMSLPIGGLQQDTIDLTISGWGSHELETEGTGLFQIGAAEVAVETGRDSDIEGTLIFSLLGKYVSINGTSGERLQQVYASMSSQERTGIAAFNPDLSSSTTLELRLFDSEGLQKASRTLVLTPGQQIARFLDEADLFEQYFSSNPQQFTGSVHIRVVTGEDVALTGLIQKLSDGALIAVEPSSKAFSPTP